MYAARGEGELTPIDIPIGVRVKKTNHSLSTHFRKRKNGALMHITKGGILVHL
jgi:hypothetical protein